MTDLSPAAQAVKDAVLALYSDEKVHKFGWQLDAPTVSAALRAVAEHCVPDDSEGHWVYIPHVIAIAAELDDTSPSS
jgi:hypothetical protein